MIGAPSQIAKRTELKSHGFFVPLFLVFFLLTMSGCTVTRLAQSGMETGHVMILPGIGGSNRWIRSFQRIIHNESPGVSAEVWDWTDIEPTWQLGDLIDLDRNLRRADALADSLVEWQNEHPGKRLYVAATSGGAGILLFACRKLPADFRLERVVLISPALSPDADLTPILSRSRKRMFFYRSPIDVLILGAGTLVFGTTDRRHVASAGMVGFRRKSDRIEELVWQPKMIFQGNLGGHLGAFSPSFARKFLLPLFEPAESPRMAIRGLSE